jgi:2-C-methyl-D-erythritol 4-phosphate cytidylyltransferase
VDFVCIHDAARPCLAEVWIDRVFEAAATSGAATLGIEVTSTIKKVVDGLVKETISRDSLWESQTPQVFRRQMLLDAFAAASDEQLRQSTDEAQLVEWQGAEVKMVTGSPLNRKVTTRGDLVFARQALKVLPKPDLLGRKTHPFQDGDMWR